ncbi:MAG: ATP-dependent helicase [Clostridiaceae bacterium]
MGQVYTLDKNQKEAVFSEENNILVVAAPGAGKTTVIINRVIHLIRDKKVSPKSIIIITFTKAAAENMKNRFAKLYSHNTKETPFFGTFHGLFYRILRNYMEVKIIDSREGYTLIKKVLTSYMDEISEEKIKETINFISLFKSSEENISDFKVNIDKEVFIKAYETYEDYKNEKGLLDFDDLQIKFYHLLKSSPRILDGYRNLFKHILVDEFQDCDDLQIKILKLLNYNNSVYAVGDEDQCIYSFRGSCPQYMLVFDEVFKDGKKKYLSINYRSNKKIIDISKKVIAFNKERNEKVINGFKTEEGEVGVEYLYNEKEQGELISQDIVDNCIKQFKYSDIAVLFRTNEESRGIIDSFIRKDIPFVLLDKEYNFFQHFICEDLLSYLRLSIDVYNRECFERIINKPFRYVSKLNIEKVKNNIIKDDVFSLFTTIEDLPVFQIKKIEDIKNKILSLNRMSLSGAISSILKDLGYLDHLREYSNKFRVSFEDLEEIVSQFEEAASSHKNIISFLTYVNEYSEVLKKQKYSKEEKDAVILSTIHGVKGMEFKKVYLINCNEDNIPHKNSVETNIEEERRLFYVGITRAIESLTICTTKYFKGKLKNPSQFLKESINIANLSLSNKYAVNDEVIHKAFGRGKVFKIEDNNIEILFKDGDIRSFNLEVLLERKLLS